MKDHFNFTLFFFFPVCKVCIVKHLQSNKVCPICNAVVHETQPTLNLRWVHACMDGWWWFWCSETLYLTTRWRRIWQRANTSTCPLCKNIAVQSDCSAAKKNVSGIFSNQLTHISNSHATSWSSVCYQTLLLRSG